MSVNGNLAKNLRLRWSQARGGPITLILLSGHQTAFSMLSCSFQHLSQKLLHGNQLTELMLLVRVQRRVMDICIPMSQAQAEGENREDRCERVFWTVAPLNSQLWFSAQDQAVNLPTQRGVGLKAHSS